MKILTVYVKEEEKKKKKTGQLTAVSEYLSFKYILSYNINNTCLGDIDRIH